MGMAVNQDMTKYMLVTSGDNIRCIGSHITVNNYTFDIVNELVIGSAVTTKNYVSLEIKRGVALSNRYYYGFNMQLSCRDFPRKKKLHNTLIFSVLL